MASYKYIQFKIGNKTFAIDINSVYRFFKVRNELLPYPGKSDNFEYITSLKIGSIPILKKDFIGIIGKKYEYLIVVVHEEKKLGILCDEIFGLMEDIDKKIELIEINKFV